jgi:tetratricopeptide (TPR) repeat protein
MRKWRIALILAFLSGAIHSQTRRADSLRILIKKQKQDTNLVKSLIELSDILEVVYPEESTKFAKEAYELSKKLNYHDGSLRSWMWYARGLANLGDTVQARVEFAKIRPAIREKETDILSNYYYCIGSLCEKRKEIQQSIKKYSTCIDLRKTLVDEARKAGMSDHAKELTTSLGYVYLNLGDVCDRNSLTDRAIDYYKSAVSLLKETGAKKYLSIAHNNIGLAYLDIGDYKMALKNYFDALKLKTELKDSVGIANTQQNIGNVYFNTGDYPASLKNYFSALEYFLKNNEIDRVTMVYSNIGIVYEYMGDLEKALASYQLSLKQAGETTDEASIASCYINIANVLIRQGDALMAGNKTKEAKAKYDQALEDQTKAIKTYEKGGDNQTLAILYLNMGGLNLRIKKYPAARDYYSKSMALSKQGHHMRELSYAYANLAELDSVTGDHKSALRNFQKYIAVRDSMVNEESSKKIIELQMQSDFDKKETEARLKQEQKDAITQKEISYQKQQRNLSLMGAGLLAFMAIFIFRGYKQKQKANNLLEEKNELIASQKHLVEEKNKEITDSINYAKRLQTAILSSERTMHAVFKESFILYKPKDIVSGDFYWILHIEDKPVKKNIFVFAAADCTGHGVPGAFMSMLNSTLLNQTAYNPNINTPADALNFLNQELPKNLRSADGIENIQDGMDIAFCLVDLNKNVLKYAGANNPCWVIRDKQLIELKPLKQAITASTEYEKKKFVDQEMALQKGDSIYVFTDGYADQFGGPDGKKFKYKTLSELLLKINNEPLHKQQQILEQRFNEWRGSLEQVDDVLLMGIRV